jgi:hypothetical protein
MPLPGARYRFKKNKDGTFTRLAFQGNKVVEVKKFKKKGEDKKLKPEGEAKRVD